MFFFYSSGGHFVHPSGSFLSFFLTDGHLRNNSIKFQRNRLKGIGGIGVQMFFSSPDHEVLMVSYCDRSMSVVRRQQFA